MKTKKKKTKTTKTTTTKDTVNINAIPVYLKNNKRLPQNLNWSPDSVYKVGAALLHLLEKSCFIDTQGSVYSFSS